MVQHVLIIRGPTFGNGKTRIAIHIYMTIKLKKAMISLNKYVHVSKSGAADCVLWLPLYSAFPKAKTFFECEPNPGGSTRS